METGRRVLFVCKRRGNPSYTGSVGLVNSARFVAEALCRAGVPAHVVEVVDNNDIDREVTRYRPTNVVIEALWVVPTKFPVLMRLHPTVRWIVRLHSRLPFLASEGIATEWLRDYGDIGGQLQMGANCAETASDLSDVLNHEVMWLPNLYPVNAIAHARPHSAVLNIGCFGAIRPLKNHLQQAIAAKLFARQLGLPLRFHVNADRVESHGEPVLKNLRNLFRGTADSLIEHPWYDRPHFLTVLGEMDINMQVSFSETFNIVSADAINVGTPVVVSPQIGWMPCFAKADPTNTSAIVRRLRLAWWCPQIFRVLGRHGLRRHNRRSWRPWQRYLQGQ